MSEDLDGQLVRVRVEAVADGCSPPRFEGDGGLQFLGRRADGGYLVSVARNVQFGPLPDGGALETVSFEQVPQAPRSASLGTDAACRSITAWGFDGGPEIDLQQTLPPLDVCGGEPLWLPDAGCTVRRRLVLTPAGSCRLTCVTVDASGDIGCSC